MTKGDEKLTIQSFNVQSIKQDLIKFNWRKPQKKVHSPILSKIEKVISYYC